MRSLLKLSELKARFESLRPEMEGFDPVAVVAVSSDAFIPTQILSEVLKKPVGVYYPSGSGYDWPRISLECNKPGRLIMVVSRYDEEMLKEMYRFIYDFRGIDYQVCMVYKDTATCKNAYHYEIYQGEGLTPPWK